MAVLVDEFSFASPAHSWPQVLVIRLVEILTGQPYLKRLYNAYRRENRPLCEFWQQAVERLDLKLRLRGAPLAAIPKTGALVFAANHPYGVLDGITLCWIAAKTRPDFKILINEVLCRAPEVMEYALPVNFDLTPAALQINLTSRKRAHEHLAAGGALAIFPAGAVSKTPGLLRRTARDDVWGPFVGHLIRRSGARLVPLYFAGQNSFSFQAACHLTDGLHSALMFREVCRRIGSFVDVVIGEPLGY